MAGTIPEQQPIGDVYSGSIIQVGDVQLLTSAGTTETGTIASGNFIIRYGLRFLGKLHISIVPGLLVLDYGEMLTGEEAWEFLLKQSNLYPRSEVMGYRNDGTEDMALIRTLDMAVPPEVLLYDTPTAIKPIAKPTALISPTTEHLPTRLLSYLPQYASLAEWQAEITQ